MSHLIIRKGGKTLLKLLIISSFLFPLISFSQVDTAKIIREVSNILKKNGIKEPFFELSIKSSNQKGGQTALVINNYNGNITIVSDVPYAEYARMDMTGLSEHVGFGLIATDTELSALMKNVVTYSPDKPLQIKMTDSALVYADRTIKKFPHFPFSYFCKAVILQSRNNSDWVNYAKKAEQIFEITTKIEGHFRGQDEALAALHNALEKIK